MESAQALTPSPGKPAHAALLWSLYGISLACRLAFVTADPFRHESLHYFVARTWGGYTHNIVPAGETRPWLWLSPLYYALLKVPAWATLEWARVPIVLITAWLPLGVLRLCLGWGVRTPLAWAGALLVALHPVFLAGGSTLGPASLAAVAVMLALRAHSQGSAGAAAAWLAAGTWISSAVLAVALVLLGQALVKGFRERRTTLWPFELDKAQTGYTYAAALGFVPLVMANAIGPRFPGVNFDSLPGLASDFSLGAVGTLGALCFLWIREARPFGIMVLLFLGAATAQQWLVGRTVDGSGQVVPLLLLLLGAILALSKRPLKAANSSGWGRAIGPIALALLVLGPFAGGGPPGLAATVDGSPFQPAMADRWEQGLGDVATRVPGPGSRLLTLDVRWHDVVYLSLPGATTYFGFSDLRFAGQHWADIHGGWMSAPNGTITSGPDWTEAVDAVALAFEAVDAVVVRTEEDPFNRAVAAALTPCLAFDRGDYALYLVDECAPSAAELDSAYQEQLR